jgi:hypothetical protein
MPPILGSLSAGSVRSYGSLRFRSAGRPGPPASLPAATFFDYLIIGGGGAGGGNGGGGGGAGGFRTGTGVPLSSNTVEIYAITIGAGGTAVSGQTGANGSNSGISAAAPFTSIFAAGGGGGGGPTTPFNGNSGGSGGGGGTPGLFPAGAQMSKVSIYASYGGGARGADYTVQWSDNNSTWTNSFSGNMSASGCGIIDGTITSSPSLGAHRYWRYVLGTVTNSHHPRYARLFLTDTTGREWRIDNPAADNCGDAGLIPGLDGPSTVGPLDCLYRFPVYAGSGNVPSVSPSQGNSGGIATPSGPYATPSRLQQSSGGGGGAGGGGSAGTGTSSGAGGAGLSSPFTGTPVTYSGGGGGGCWVAPGSAGPGSSPGGNGATGSPGTGSAGGVNTGGGGGGGGGSAPATASTGGNGGSGRVVIRFPDSNRNAFVTGANTFTISGGNKIYSFTGSGTIRFLGPTANIVNVSCYSTYSGGARAANYNLFYSDDGINYYIAWSGNMGSTGCGIITGTKDDAANVISFGNHPFWRYEVTTSTIGHHPRVSRIFLTSNTGTTYTMASYAGDNCSDSGFIPGLDGSGIVGPTTITS